MNKQNYAIRLFRTFGILDGVSLVILFFIAMPLKYFADMPQIVSVVGAIHGAIFTCYAISVIIAQLAIQWKFRWTLFAFVVAFIPTANFFLDRYISKREQQFYAKPFPIIWIVYSIIFFTFIDLFAQLPIMSTFAQSLGASLSLVGLIVGMYSFANTGGNIFAGYFTDKFGAYKILLTGLIGTIIILVCYSFVTTPGVLLIIRFLHGFVGGFIVPAAFTFVANQGERSKAGSQNAITGSFVGIAAIIGPAFSGIVASLTSAPTVLGIVGVFGACLLIVAIVGLRKVAFNKEKKERAPLNWNLQVIASFVGAFSLMLSQGALAYLLPLRVSDFGMDSSFSGTLLSVFGVIAVIVFVSPLKRMFDRIKPIYCFMAGLMLLAISQLALGTINNVSLFYGILALYGLGFSFIFPSINVLLVRGTSKLNRGKAYGYFYAFFSLGTVAGSSLLGTLHDDIKVLFMITSASLFVVVCLAFIAKRYINTEKISQES